MGESNLKESCKQESANAHICERSEKTSLILSVGNSRWDNCSQWQILVLNRKDWRQLHDALRQRKHPHCQKKKVAVTNFHLTLIEKQVLFLGKEPKLTQS